MVHAQKSKQPSKADEQIDAPPGQIDESGLDASTADILDELDEILSEMDEDFALKYVQRGGE